MIAELLYSLITYLLFTPNNVALRGPLSHQTHFLASSKWLVSLHLTPHHPMSSLVRVWRRKRLQGHWLSLHTFNCRKNLKPTTLLYFLLMCSVTRCQLSELLWTREKEGEQVYLFIMIRLSPFLSCCHGIFFPLVFPRARARLDMVRRARSFSAYTSCILHCSHSFSPLDSRDDGRLVFGWNHFQNRVCVCASLCLLSRFLSWEGQIWGEDFQERIGGFGQAGRAESEG